jgi:hypothetical protein
MNDAGIRAVTGRLPRGKGRFRGIFNLLNTTLTRPWPQGSESRTRTYRHGEVAGEEITQAASTKNNLEFLSELYDREVDKYLELNDAVLYTL